MLHHTWPEAEPIILTNSQAILLYLEWAKKSAWPEAEPTLLKQKNAGLLYTYSVAYRKTRWPEAEPIIKAESPYHWDLYTRKFPDAKG